MDGRRSDLYKDVQSKDIAALKLSQLKCKPSSLISRKNLPLEAKNVNITSLFGLKKTEHNDHRRRPLSSISRKSHVAASQDTNNVRSLGSILRNSKLPNLSQSMNRTGVEVEGFQDSYAMRRRIREDDGNCIVKSDRRKNSLVNRLIRALNDLNLVVKTSQRDQNYDILIEIRYVVRLSPYEIMVTSDDTRVKKAVLHSHTPIPKLGNLPSRLAICSKCCFTLYNDMNWYLKWKFL